MIDSILSDIDARFGILWRHKQRDDLMQIGINPGQLVQLLAWLRDGTGFVQLTHMSVVDWIEDGAFQLTYMISDPKARQMLMVCVQIDRQEARADSVAHLWPQAVTYEQELNEMYGVTFPGSPRLGVPFILEDWQDMPPMRRDFDTLAYVDKNHPMRPGRHHIDTRDYVGEVHGEKSLLNLRDDEAANKVRAAKEPA